MVIYIYVTKLILYTINVIDVLKNIFYLAFKKYKMKVMSESRHMMVSAGH